MSVDRREFLRLAGSAAAFGCALGLSYKSAAGEDSLLLSPSKPNGPLVAKRWAMVVDFKKCLEIANCRDCIDACHATHNVPRFENPKDEIKWIWKEKFEGAFPDIEHKHLAHELIEKPVLVLCNHCDNPPCVGVCPTKATWRRDDGIVMMDWHRCIGCRYCIAACPYGSRSFNWRDPRPFIKELRPDFPTRTRGVVEKCTFCEERLAKGLIPACVEACKYKALHFGDLEDPDSEIRQILSERFTVRRKAGLGTNPEIYYII